MLLKNRRVRNEIATVAGKAAEFSGPWRAPWQSTEPVRTEDVFSQGDLFAGAWDVMHFWVVVGNQLQVCIVHLKREANPRGQDQQPKKGIGKRQAAAKYTYLEVFLCPFFPSLSRSQFATFLNTGNSKARKGRRRRQSCGFPPPPSRVRKLPDWQKACKSCFTKE